MSYEEAVMEDAIENKLAEKIAFEGHTAESAQHEIEQEINEITQAFVAYDANGDGFISRDELQALFLELNHGFWDDDKFDQLFMDADVNGDGMLQYEEFLKWCFDGDGEEEEDEFWT